MTTPRTPTYGIGATRKQVTIRELDLSSGYARAIDTEGSYVDVVYAVDRTGLTPQPGETWFVDRDYGPWTFSARLDTSSLPDANASATDTHNVRAYGARCDGLTDDTAAVQAALDACEPGGTVYVPGVCRTSSPVTMRPYQTLMGSHGSGENETGAAAPPASLRPLPQFSGEAVIRIVDQQMGGFDTRASEPRIFQLTIDCSDLPRENAEVDGIRATGQVQHLQLRDVQVRWATGIGINTTYNLNMPSGPQAPFCLHFDRVSVLWGKGIGIALNNSTDSTFHDVYVLGNGGMGWWISGAGNSTFTACRAEWSGGEGFNLQGWHSVIQMTSCSTDRNTRDGILVTSPDADGILQLTGCRLTRDGRNGGAGGGDRAGLKVFNAKARVLASDLIVTTGNDDDGAAGASPMYGAWVSGSTYTVLNSGYITGTTQGIHDGGGNVTLKRGALL